MKGRRLTTRSPFEIPETAMGNRSKIRLSAPQNIIDAKSETLLSHRGVEAVLANKSSYCPLTEKISTLTTNANKSPSMPSTQNVSPPALTSRSINLPGLAIDAANELDDIENGIRSESPAAARLGQILKQSFASASRREPQITAKSGTVAVFCDALESLQVYSDTNDYKTIVLKAQDYARQLKAQKSPEGQTTLTDIKIFCIALAKAAAGHRESVIDTQAGNHWR